MGVLAQLVERLNGIEKVRGSNPLGSTISPTYLETPHCLGSTSHLLTLPFHTPLLALAPVSLSTPKQRHENYFPCSVKELFSSKAWVPFSHVNPQSRIASKSGPSAFPFSVSR